MFHSIAFKFLLLGILDCLTFYFVLLSLQCTEEQSVKLKYISFLLVGFIKQNKANLPVYESHIPKRYAIKKEAFLMRKYLIVWNVITLIQERESLPGSFFIYFECIKNSLIYLLQMIRTLLWKRKNNKENESLFVAAQNNSIWTNYVKAKLDDTIEKQVSGMLC